MSESTIDRSHYLPLDQALAAGWTPVPCHRAADPGDRPCNAVALYAAGGRIAWCLELDDGRRVLELPARRPAPPKPEATVLEFLLGDRIKMSEPLRLPAGFDLDGAVEWIELIEFAVDRLSPTALAAELKSYGWSVAQSMTPNLPDDGYGYGPQFELRAQVNLPGLRHAVVRERLLESILEASAGSDEEGSHG